MQSLPLDSGGIIHASHIEKPVSTFRVDFDDIGYTNVLTFAEGKRWVRVLAQTPDGAIKIARYHYGSRGSNFVSAMESA